MRCRACELVLSFIDSLGEHEAKELRDQLRAEHPGACPEQVSISRLIVQFTVEGLEA